MEGHMIVIFDKGTKYCIPAKREGKTEQKCTAKWVSKVSLDKVIFEEDTTIGCTAAVRRGSVKEMASTFHDVDSNVDV